MAMSSGYPTPPTNPTPTTVTTQTCPACPDMEIEINNTPATDDDLVLLKCEHPAHRSKTKCRIRAVACSGGSSATVVLVNPDGRLRFPEIGDTTKTLSLPSNGSWVPFEISGEKGSNAIGDAIIEAHCQNATGAIKAKAKVTVVWFDPVTITITPGGTYSLTGGLYTVTGGHGVDYAAQATIKPAGVNCSAPQVKNLRVGIMQNVRAGVRGMHTWGNPRIAWGSTASRGASVTVPQSIQATITRPVDANDAESAVNPLYDQPGVKTTIDAGSLAKPKGCSGGGTATSWDTPQNQVPPTITQNAINTSTGVIIGTVTYSLISTRIDNDFTTWAAIYDTATKHACALRQRTWSVHVSSTAAGKQQATVGTDSAPTQDPIVGSPYSNDLVNNPANQTVTTSGTITFVRP